MLSIGKKICSLRSKDQSCLQKAFLPFWKKKLKLKLKWKSPYKSVRILPQKETGADKA